MCYNDEWFLSIITGPDLPLQLVSHSMVSLGEGQAILGGNSENLYNKRIFYISCSQLICDVSTLSQELLAQRGSFVAIPIPDSISGCISESESWIFSQNFSLQMWLVKYSGFQ